MVRTGWRSGSHSRSMRGPNPILRSRTVPDDGFRRSATALKVLIGIARKGEKDDRVRMPSIWPIGRAMNDVSMIQTRLPGCDRNRRCASSVRRSIGILGCGWFPSGVSARLWFGVKIPDGLASSGLFLIPGLLSGWISVAGCVRHDATMVLGESVQCGPNERL